MLEPQWILVAGDFRASGGMDKANASFAEYLVERGTAIHLVCHSASLTLSSSALVTVHRVPKPLNSYFLGSPLLDWKASRLFRSLSCTWPNVRTVANGGNCTFADVNWSHYVHSAWRPANPNAPFWFRFRRGLEHRVECWRERRAYRNARLIIANSKSTQYSVQKCIGKAATPAGAQQRLATVYLGVDPGSVPATAADRALTRERLQLPPDRKTAIFVGGLSFDGRKNFDAVIDAWQILCSDPQWDVDLLVAGTGPSKPYWEKQIEQRNVGSRIRMLGFSPDIPGLLTASDVLVSVSRYEPYGLNVQEALARGLSVITSAEAGIAERFPAELRPMLILEGDGAMGLAKRLQVWRADPEGWRRRCARFGQSLSTRTWREMAQEMLELIEDIPVSSKPTYPALSAISR